VEAAVTPSMRHEVLLGFIYLALLTIVVLLTKRRISKLRVFNA
jgi:hypothetical protein